MRDGLSLLDQALAMGSGSVDGAQVRAMLGLADRGRIFDLLEKLLGGTAGEALEQFARLHRDGAEPQQVLADLAEAVHVTTRAKSLGVEAAGEGLSAEERRRAAALGGRLSMAILSRAWQMLLKGLEEAAKAPNPAAAAEMVLIRLAYTADLPPPDEIIKTLGGDAVGVRAGGKPAGRRREAACGRRRPSMSLDADKPATESDFSDEDDERAPRTMRLRRCRSCARSPRWWSWQARAARPSSRSTWKST